MALFRKSKKTNETSREREARIETEKNRAKWNELESLITDQAPSTDETSPKIPELDTHNLLNTASEDFASDLKVEMPVDSEFIDITPPEPSVLAAMVPSAHFDSSARK